MIDRPAALSPWGLGRYGLIWEAGRCARRSAPPPPPTEPRHQRPGHQRRATATAGRSGWDIKGDGRPPGTAAVINQGLKP